MPHEKVRGVDLCRLYLSCGSLCYISLFLRYLVSVLWIYQEGSTVWDRVHGAAALSAGGVILAGYSKGNWSGMNKGLEDFTAVELDLNGTVLWRWQVIQKPPCASSLKCSGCRATVSQISCSA